MYKSKNKNALLFLGLGLGLTALIGIGWWYVQKKKKEEEGQALLPETGSSAAPSAPTQIPVKPFIQSSPFPLVKGYRNEQVKQLQEALNKNFGMTIKVDGVFGNETAFALERNGFSTIVTAELLAKIIQGKKAVETAPTTKPKVPELFNTEQAIRSAGRIKELIENKGIHALTIEILRLKNVSNYRMVNEIFKNYRVNGVRKTLVNAVLDPHFDPQSKEFIKEALMKIGLKYHPATKQWTMY